jgi:hypothetical protein
MRICRPEDQHPDEPRASKTPPIAFTATTIVAPIVQPESDGDDFEDEEKPPTPPTHKDSKMHEYHTEGTNKGRNGLTTMYFAALQQTNKSSLYERVPLPPDDPPSVRRGAAVKDVEKEQRQAKRDR